jgi:hypothetical protein
MARTVLFGKLCQSPLLLRFLRDQVGDDRRAQDIGRRRRIAARADQCPHLLQACIR